MKDSKAVNEAIRRTYATLAQAAAQRAMLKIRCDDNPHTADTWIATFERLLRKAGSRAAQWNYSVPRP